MVSGFCPADILNGQDQARDTQLTDATGDRTKGQKKQDTSFLGAIHSNSPRQLVSATYSS